MGSAPVKIKSQLPKEEDENGLDWNCSRVFLQHPTEQHIIVAYVHTGQIIEDYDADYGSRTPVLVIDAVEHLGSILDAPEEVRRAFQARHARRTGGGATLLDEPEPPFRPLPVTHRDRMELLDAFDIGMAALDRYLAGADPHTGEILPGHESDDQEQDDEFVILPETVDELTEEIASWQRAWAELTMNIGIGETAGLAELVAYFRVATRRLDRYAAGKQADVWPSDAVASAVVRYACQIIMSALATAGATNVRYAAVRDAISDLQQTWTLAVPQLYGYLLDPLNGALDAWAHEHPWDAGAMDRLGAGS